VKKAFVTGGAGFLGVNLVEQLLAAGWEVVVFDTAEADASHLQKPGVSLVTGDITEEMRSTALESSINYFRSKRLAELEVQRGCERGLDAVILNPSNILGPHDRSGWSRFFRLIDEKRLPGVPPGRASFCPVREVAAAHLAAFERGRSGHHYLLGGIDATFLELVQQIGELLGRPTPSRPTPAFLSKLAGRLSLWGSYLTRREPDLTPEKATLLSSELLCSSEKAEQELGYRGVPLRTMLEDCHRWMLDEGLLERRATARPTRPSG
jgi:nucleoside-diphosphate-sugar epimerase